MERHTTDTSLQPLPDELAEKIETRSDDMGWSTDSVRRMYVDPQPHASSQRSHSKRKYHNKSKVPDDDSAHDPNWNVPPEQLTDEQLMINRTGIDKVRAAAHHEAPAYDSKTMVETALANWEQVAADSRQVHTETEVEERGVYIGLDERQVAVDAIVAMYAQRNGADGFRHALEDPIHAKDLFERYEYPEIIAAKKDQTARNNQPKLKLAIATLVKQQELLAQGFPLDDIASAAEETEQEIVETFGEDARYPDREKALRDFRLATKKRS